jgi:hypothetical protein
VKRHRPYQRAGKIGKPRKSRIIKSEAPDCQSCVEKAFRITDLEARVAKMTTTIIELSQVRESRIPLAWSSALSLPFCVTLSRLSCSLTVNCPLFLNVFLALPTFLQPTVTTSVRAASKFSQVFC